MQLHMYYFIQDIFACYISNVPLYADYFCSYEEIMQQINHIINFWLKQIVDCNL